MPSYSELSTFFSMLMVILLVVMIIRSLIRMFKDKAYASRTFPKPNDSDWIFIAVFTLLWASSGVFGALADGIDMSIALFVGALLIVVMCIMYLVVRLVPEKYHEDLYTIVVLGHIFRILDRLKK